MAALKNAENPQKRKPPIKQFFFAMERHDSNANLYCLNDDLAEKINDMIDKKNKNKA